MTTVRAYAATAPDAPLTATTIERRPPGPHDVQIAIAYSGICHSDIHTVRAEWGRPPYPLVPGHEITGTVEAVGSEVTRFAVGDRAGVGVYVGSCGGCDSCRRGLGQYCLNGVIWTYNAEDHDGSITQGGYATGIVVDEDHVLHIPDRLALDRAAPLLCAGITLYSPLVRWGAGPGKRVAVVGMGGLGHMGVQIAHALGAEVTVLSHTLRKADDARRFGADECHATSDPATFEQLRNRFDLIVNTVSAVLDVNAYLDLLRVDGVMVQLGLPDRPVELSVQQLTGKRRSLAGSVIGSVTETQEMLDFCAEHDVAAQIELIEADQINAAYDRVVASEVRYRCVIDASTI